MRTWLWIPVVVVGVSLFGCSSADNPTVEEVLRKVGTPYCDKIKECTSDVFGLAYPNGISQCVQAIINGTNKDKNAKSVCDNGQVDACIADIKILSCSAVISTDSKSLPTSCQKC